ncbi:hypothetical protein GQ55_8G226000 [Panicum hallii var. hallii]|jgi:hypothetical protein|uniref:Uncharacterized protein n=2 Tax=Panicum hallii TaxID=206008 RepID=A0A2T7CQ39_9POAL|nr:hypothetical protein GQ55_8G226000 [Panicum hallii var. hallii]PVH34480.1 hypothetical protein PAHAL_8G229000 [Panicum hallii]
MFQELATMVCSRIFSLSFLSIWAMQGAGGSFRLPKKVVFACLVLFWARTKATVLFKEKRKNQSYLSILKCLFFPSKPPVFPHATNSHYSTKGKQETQTINPQRSEAGNHSNGEQAIQSSKQMPKEDDDKDDDDQEVIQAVLVCEHARKVGKNLPRSRGELEVCQASGVLQASENFLSFCCLPGWSLAELGRGEKSSFSALRGAEEQVWS